MRTRCLLLPLLVACGGDDDDTRTLTVTIVGSGTVTSEPAGIDCGEACSAELPDGATIVLIATPAANFSFDGWIGGGCSGMGLCSVTVGSSVTVRADFRPFPELTVVLGGNGMGSVTSAPAGIDCGSDCNEVYPPQIPVRLTAVAAMGSTFTGWSGGGCSGINGCWLVYTASLTVTAVFAP